MQKERCPFFVLGRGSNTIFDDQGFDGLVILNKMSALKSDEAGLYEVEGGYSFSRLGALTAKAHFTGLEFASGIPGSVGGAIFMNAGANGLETANTLLSVNYLFESGELKTFSKSELSFSYRTSPFQKMKGAILSGTFQLQKNSEAREKQIALIDYRTATQPYNEKSAGCMFRNPEGHSAGRLIEESGLKKFSIGDAFVSEKHANFICNRGSATAKEVLELIQEIQVRVKQKTGLELETEVRFIPYRGEV